jgi:protein-S-isoprenylcysteine O-methyltransferase Ste14
LVIHVIGLSTSLIIGVTTVVTDNRLDKKISINRKGILARGGQILFVFVFLGLVLFLAAGSLHWIAAWVYLGISIVAVLINAILMLRINPETVAERGQAKGWQDWDKWVSGLFALFQYFILPLVAGLDARLHWSGEIGLMWHAIGAALYAIGMAGTSWAMVSNAYFSTAARIQSERGQQVCSSGPYRFIRHPGYTGIILQAVSVAVLLGSVWALIPAVLAASLMIIRTTMEDKMLQTGLPGYMEYTQIVKFRLIPGVW